MNICSIRGTVEAVTVQKYILGNVTSEKNVPSTYFNPEQWAELLTLSTKVPPVALQITASLILLDSVYILPLLNICALLCWHRHVFSTTGWILTATTTYFLPVKAVTTDLSCLWLHCCVGPVSQYSDVFPIIWIILFFYSCTCPTMWEDKHSWVLRHCMCTYTERNLRIALKHINQGFCSHLWSCKQAHNRLPLYHALSP